MDESIFLSMDKNHKAILNMEDNHDVDYVPGTPEERMRLVWPMTREIASLRVKYDIERRLKRHVSRLIRREG